MKTIFIISIISFLFFINKLSAQEPITSKQNLSALRIDEYENKKLKTFLEYLKLEVKSIGYEKEGEDNPNQITLRFDERTSYNLKRNNNIMPARITIQFIPNQETKTLFKPLNDSNLFEKEEEIINFISKIKNLKIFRIYGYSESKIQ